MQTLDIKPDVLQVKLTKGLYKPGDAHDLVLKAVEQEGKFHRLQNYISQVRYEEDCEQAQANLRRLEQVSEEFKDLFAKAKERQTLLKVETVVRIIEVEE